MIYYLSLPLLILLASFKPQSPTPPSNNAKESDTYEVLSTIVGDSIHSRIVVPENFERVNVDSNSFGYYLRHLPLKPINSKVKHYDGRIKYNQNVSEAVIDLPIGNKDLHQCADAVMRLRADYLRDIGSQDDIHFNFSNGMRVDYAKWRKGYRIHINGNHTSWHLDAEPSDDQQSYWQYLEQIWMYAGTLSLSKELKSIPISKMQIGDILIQGGSPGHAVIVVDMAINKNTEEIVYLLAQSYMPAQDLHILKNLNDSELSPWYQLSDEPLISTPEWTFNSENLKRFE